MCAYTVHTSTYGVAIYIATIQRIRNRLKRHQIINTYSINVSAWLFRRAWEAGILSEQFLMFMGRLTNESNNLWVVRVERYSGAPLSIKVSPG